MKPLAILFWAQVNRTRAFRPDWGGRAGRPLGLLLLAGAGFTCQKAQAQAQAQARVTISGTVKDAQTGEDLTGASVHLVELPGVGAAANAYGFYTLTVPAGTYTVEATFVGYPAQRRQVALSKSQRLDFKLTPGGQELTEVVVTGRSSQANISRAQGGVETLDIKQIAKVPVLFGEKDVIKTLTLLPGIKIPSKSFHNRSLSQSRYMVRL